AVGEAMNQGEAASVFCQFVHGTYAGGTAVVSRTVERPISALQQPAVWVTGTTVTPVEVEQDAIAGPVLVQSKNGAGVVGAAGGSQAVKPAIAGSEQVRSRRAIGQATTVQVAQDAEPASVSVELEDRSQIVAAARLRHAVEGAIATLNQAPLAGS